MEGLRVEAAFRFGSRPGEGFGPPLVGAELGVDNF